VSVPRNWLREPGIFRILADDTYDWESWFDPDGKPLWVNHAVERMTGYRVPECLAMENYPLPLVVPSDEEVVRDVLAAARAGRAGNDVEFQVKTYTGQTLWVAMSWQSTQDASGRPLGFRTSIRDIQQRKTLELELRDALKAARAGERAREDFLATVSHEMRTPLQCIIGYAELLHQGHSAYDRARYGDVILGQAREALGLIDDLLRLASSASADEIDRVVVQPRALVEDVVSALRPLAVSS
jgi:PAS domain S-box-containing protein